MVINESRKALEEGLELLQLITNLLSKGVNGVREFLKDIWKKIVDWFKLNLKQFEKKLVLVNDETEFIKRYTLSTAQHINYGEVRIKKINPKLGKKDPNFIVEEYSYTPKRGKTGISKYNYRAIVGGMHNLNNLNRYVRLVGKLELAGKLPSGEKVYKGLVEFYVKELKAWSKPKISTFFPKKWSQEKIKKVIQEASMNIYHNDGNLYRGITNDGIRIEMRIDEISKEIRTAYITFN